MRFSNLIEYRVRTKLNITEFAALKRKFTKFTRNARNCARNEKSAACIFLLLRPLYANEFFAAVIQFSFPLRVRVGDLYIQLDLFLLSYGKRKTHMPGPLYIFYIAKYGTAILIVCQRFLYIFLSFIDRSNSRIYCVSF